MQTHAILKWGNTTQNTTHAVSVYVSVVTRAFQKANRDHAFGFAK